jgi:hypothetical protein
VTDWIKHDGGPQPVADDVWMEVIWPTAEGLYLATCRDEIETADEIPWDGKQRYRILNQHLIDAARLEGIRLGLEAAARDVWHTGWHSRPSLVETAEAIRLLDPATIAREAALDKLASEAQEQGMGYEKEADR